MPHSPSSRPVSIPFPPYPSFFLEDRPLSSRVLLLAILELLQLRLLPLLAQRACFVSRKASPFPVVGFFPDSPSLSRLVCLVSSNFARPRSFVVQQIRPPISNRSIFLDGYTRILHLTRQRRIWLSYTTNQTTNLYLISTHSHWLSVALFSLVSFSAAM